MPYAIRKVRNKDCWMVINKETGQVKSKCTSRKNAEAQVRLLYGVKYGMIPRGRSPKGRKVTPKRKAQKRMTSPRSPRRR